MITIEIVELLRACLRDVESASGAARPDVEWLRLRCDDTLGYAGQSQWDSLRQLGKDAAQFISDFPGVLPPLLEAVVAQNT